MNTILFRCSKQLWGKKLVLNLPKVSVTYLNTRFMSEATHQIHDFDEKKDAKLGDFSKLSISNETVKRLKNADINHLFAVQYDTFNHIKEGNDVIVQARTGTGKTLAFALPLLENLREKDKERAKRGRSPMVLTLAPTRELAIQIYKEFEKFKSRNVSVSCFYGGSSYHKQEYDLQNGIDILVGTPGRILDHINRNNLDCTNLKHVILDEADRMLDMGFQKEIDQILSNAYTKENKPQTLLFSATVPPWVKKTAEKYTSTDVKQFDFIGAAVKSAVLVEHKAVMCPWNKRAATIKDVMQVCSGKHGKTLVFTSTKREADQLANESVLNMNSQALHGDMSQNARERTLEGFRAGTFNCLIATDVASRGLDIPEIDLVIQTEPPQDVDFYIHRAGRTGRAGRDGVSIVLYNERQGYDMQQVERTTGVLFSQIDAPTRDEVGYSLARDAVKSLDEVKLEVIEHFIPYAQDLIVSRGAENALTLALASVSSHQGGTFNNHVSSTKICSYVDNAVRSLDDVTSVKYFVPSAKDLIDSRGAEDALATALACVSSNLCEVQSRNTHGEGRWTVQRNTHGEGRWAVQRNTHGEGRWPVQRNNNPSEGRHPVQRNNNPSEGRRPVQRNNNPSEGHRPVQRNNNPSEGRRPVQRNNNPSEGSWPVQHDYSDKNNNFNNQSNFNDRNRSNFSNRNSNSSMDKGGNSFNHEDDKDTTFKVDFNEFLDELKKDFKKE